MIHFFTNSVHEIYTYIRKQPQIRTGVAHDYQMIHDKAGQLALLLLLYAKNSRETNLPTLPMFSQDPETVAICKQESEPLFLQFVSRLDDEQRQMLYTLEESQSKAEWEMNKEVYALGMMNGMIQLVNIVALVFGVDEDSMM